MMSIQGEGNIIHLHLSPFRRIEIGFRPLLQILQRLYVSEFPLKSEKSMFHVSVSVILTVRNSFCFLKLSSRALLFMREELDDALTGACPTKLVELFSFSPGKLFCWFWLGMEMLLRDFASASSSNCSSNGVSSSSDPEGTNGPVSSFVYRKTLFVSLSPMSKSS